ncbi:MAG: cupin domain-containing protein [Gemmatimonadaceae bacterium]
MKNRTLILTLAVVAICALLGANTSQLAAHGGTPATDTTPITDVSLGHGLPGNAPGQVLTLERITLAPGAAFPVHVHPGAYVVMVESGTLEFPILKGEAVVTRAGSTTPETVKAGTTAVLNAGDSLFEQEGVVHTARNAGKEPVVILAASLLAADQPGLQPSNDQGTPAS